MRSKQTHDMSDEKCSSIPFLLSLRISICPVMCFESGGLITQTWRPCIQFFPLKVNEDPHSETDPLDQTICRASFSHCQSRDVHFHVPAMRFICQVSMFIRRSERSHKLHLYTRTNSRDHCLSWFWAFPNRQDSITNQIYTDPWTEMTKKKKLLTDSINKQENDTNLWIIKLQSPKNWG